jgi:hypothetical protein
MRARPNGPILATAIEEDVCPSWYAKGYPMNAGLCTGIDLPLNPQLPPQTDWTKFDKLDCLGGPGLTEKEFLGLFIKCDACALVTMHLVFDNHRCIARKQ